MNSIVRRLICVMLLCLSLVGHERTRNGTFLVFVYGGETKTKSPIVVFIFTLKTEAQKEQFSVWGRKGETSKNKKNSMFFPWILAFSCAPQDINKTWNKSATIISTHMSKYNRHWSEAHMIRSFSRSLYYFWFSKN